MAADLRIIGVNYRKDRLIAGREKEFEVVIDNKGNVKSSPFTIAVYDMNNKRLAYYNKKSGTGTAGYNKIGLDVKRKEEGWHTFKFVIEGGESTHNEWYECTYWGEDEESIRTYSYEKTDNGQLYIIQTSPDNITFRAKWGKICKNSDFYEINGGFFSKEKPYHVISIAVMDHEPVWRTKEHWGAGWYNHYIPSNIEDADPNYMYPLNRGTLIWDKVKRKYTMARIGSAYDIANQGLVEDLSNYWAQGGISMSLQDDDWKEITEEEHIKATNTYRSGLVYDSHMNLFLVVSVGKHSPDSFRSTIKNTIPNVVDGIFLDGSSCAQMNCKEKTVDRDRTILQRICLINK